MQLTWQQLLPTLDKYQSVITQACQQPPLDVMALQPRLSNSLATFLDHRSYSRFMLVKAPTDYTHLKLIGEAVNKKLPSSSPVIGARYHINHEQVTYHRATEPSDNFAATDRCLYDEWFSFEQLFGCLRHTDQQYQLVPGLVHRANGGVLLLSLRTLLAQPVLWLKLKQTVESGRFDWESPDENRPFPLTIPSMPIDLKIILVGDRLTLADLQDIDDTFTHTTYYGEFENNLMINTHDDVSHWCRYVKGLTEMANLPMLTEDAYGQLLKIATRFTGDQLTLPLSPCWLSKQLHDAYCQLNSPMAQITSDVIRQSQTAKQWQESYLFACHRSETEQQQITIDSEGSVIGQINGLSVLEYPGYPLPIGEVSRISCVLQLGDGEIIDVERKAELGGNLHAKGMMIMHAFISSALALEQQLPFSSSIVFEQSYGEVDGDSASLAELCVLLSALSQQPIDQQIAVTGSVDQFGNVQAIGGINEKIEAFFDICQYRGLTGKQGVIIPKHNLRHLSLNESVIDAVKAETFHLFAIDHVSQAIPILMHLPYDDTHSPSILMMINKRINQLNQYDKAKLPWPLRWLN